MNIADSSSVFPAIGQRPTRRRKSATGRQARWGSRLRQHFTNVKDILTGISLMTSSTTAERTETGSSTRVPFFAVLSVMPALAHVNAPRLLTVTAHFPVGCGPSSATASVVSVGGTDVLEVRFDQSSPDFAFSDLVLVPYTVELTYTPSEAGDLLVRMVTVDGVTVGESVVMTRNHRGEDTQFDVTGKWIDPSADKNRLALVPDAPSSSAVVGIWNFHDHQGVCRQYAIQSVHWKQANVEAEGAIFDTTPSVATAPSPDLASAASAAASQLGLARITFHGLNSARIFALGFGGNVLFTSNLVRTAY
ncbi:MAG: hypothetical protein ABI583_13555 [Betaproteobacteria bacterium]